MFQFVKPSRKNNEGKTIYNALRLNEIDKLACEFWQVEESKTRYASPKVALNGKIEYGTNWFDTIGLSIESCQYRFCKKDNGNYYHDAIEQSTLSHGAIFDASAVSAQILRVASLATTSAEDLNKSIQYYQPYIEFVFHLQNEHNIYFEALGW